MMGAPSWRVGMGFDVHPFSDDQERCLILGGVRVVGRGLRGHSDADAVAHSVADALLGAARLGDLGEWFPAEDPRWAGVDSMDLLADVVAAVEGRFRVGNVDCTILAEAPRLAPYRTEMETSLSGVVGAEVAVKLKRGEGLGAIGRAEGIACWAVALIEAR
jgi:2-C-methyl-D-erythritol 2,4-cyclodiphosphate synthase